MTDIEGIAAVRPFEADDAEAYVELLHRLDRESSFLLWEPGERSIEPSVLRERARQADRADGVHLVADAAGDLVGFVVAHRGAVRAVRGLRPRLIAVAIRDSVGA
ncbi:hypothetical protein BH23ACT3_BH23ACT3_13330 [soil metagenome]